MSKICFIGSGNMAEAIIKGILNAKVFASDDIIASDTNEQRIEYIQSKYMIRTTKNEPYIINKADIIVLAVKPQSLPAMMKDLSSYFRQDALIISILAGTTIKTIEKYFSGKSRIARIMPNLGAFVGKSVSALCFNEHILKKDKTTVETIFQSIGYTHFCEEKDMDAVTAISGSGPAYLFHFMEIFVESAIKLGMTKDQAFSFCLETIEGALKLISLKTESPKALREKVTSKGGTTEAALNYLDSKNFAQILKSAITKAYDRSKALGEEC